MAGHAPLPPRHPQRRATAAPARATAGKRPKRSGPPIVPFVIGGVVLVALGVGAVAAFRWIGGGGLGGGAGVSIPILGDIPGIGADSPKAVVGDFVDAVKDMQSTLNSVQDEQSRVAAMSEFLKLKGRLEELQRRCVLLEPIPKEELKAVTEQFKGSLDEDALKSDIERLGNSGLVDEEFGAALRDFQFELGRTFGMVKHGLETMPEPKNELETLFRDYALANRKFARILAQVEDESDVPEATGQLKQLESEFFKLADQRAARSEPQTIVNSHQGKYLGFITSMSVYASGRALARQEGEFAPLWDAYSQTSTAASDFNFAGMAGVPRPSRAGEPGHAASTNSQPPVPQGNTAGTETAGTGRPGGFGQPGGFGPPGAAGRPFVPGGASEPPATRASAEMLIVVLEGGPFIDLQGLTPGQREPVIAQRRSQLPVITRTVQSLASSKEARSTVLRDRAQIDLAFSGDVQAVADKIEFGKVMSVDVTARRITVQLPDVSY